MILLKEPTILNMPKLLDRRPHDLCGRIITNYFLKKNVNMSDMIEFCEMMFHAVENRVMTKMIATYSVES